MDRTPSRKSTIFMGVLVMILGLAVVSVGVAMGFFRWEQIKDFDQAAKQATATVIGGRSSRTSSGSWQQQTTFVLVQDDNGRKWEAVLSGSPSGSTFLVRYDPAMPDVVHGRGSPDRNLSLFKQVAIWGAVCTAIGIAVLCIAIFGMRRD